MIGLETTIGRNVQAMGSTTPRAAEPVSTLEDFVCRLLCGVSSAWPFSSDAELQSQFLQYTNRHGVQPMLYVLLRSSAASGSWPPDLLQALSDEAASQAVVEMIQGQESAKALKALSPTERAEVLKLNSIALRFHHSLSATKK